MSKIENIIKAYVGETDNNLFKAVANDILNCGYEGEDIKNHVEDILNHGCISGCVSSMIYYSDTEKFFDKYSSEIFDLLNDMTEEIGAFPLKKGIEINKNNLSWFTYEEVSYRLNDYIDEKLEECDTIVQECFDIETCEGCHDDSIEDYSSEEDFYLSNVIKDNYITYLEGEYYINNELAKDLQQEIIDSIKDYCNEKEVAL